MSVHILSQVLRTSEHRLAQRLVLIALADGAHDDGLTWDGQTTLAAKAGLSEAHVRECLRKLENANAVETRVAQRGRLRHNVYRVLVPDLVDVDPERLPFKLTEPFTTTAEVPRPSPATTAEPSDDDRGSTADDRGNSPATTAEILALRARDEGPVIGPVMDPSKDPVRAPARVPPPLEKIDGQNVAFNTLRDECGITPGSNRERDVAHALNGTRSATGIRTLAWNELVSVRGADYVHAKLRDDPTAFETGLAGMIARRAEIYRQTMGEAELTPRALAKWWLDLEGRKPHERRGGLSPDEMLAVLREA